MDQQTRDYLEGLFQKTTVTKEDLRTEIQKVLESELGKIDKARHKWETKLNRQLRKYSTDQIERVETAIAVNSLAIHFVVPPTVILLLVFCAAIKNAKSFDFVGLIKNPAGVFDLVKPQGQIRGNYSDATLVEKGMVVENFEITSGFGERPAPTPGASTFHKGVDLATPTGTPIFAIGEVNVTCQEQNPGAGIYALVDYRDKNFVLMHLSQCKTGNYFKGQIFAKSGATGTGTGPHLHFEQYDKDNVLERPTVGYVSGFLNPNYGSLDEVKRAIGHAEGTLNVDGTKTVHWESHTDPGNDETNQGTFSYQHEASSPEEADQKQLAKLKKVEAEFLEINPKLTKLELLNGLDLFNQSELASVGYVQRLKLHAHESEKTRIITARIGGYYTKTGVLDAPGFGNDFKRLHEDQVRRFEAIKATIK
jgi:murein DD-endopeptidase MepM/ murein hydrolase activator NlpD